MMEKAKIKQAIQGFFQKDDKWRELFFNAPPIARLRLAISFYYSTYKDQFTTENADEYRELREQIEKDMKKEDLEYMIENIGKEESSEHYKSLLESKEQEELESLGQPQQALNPDNSESSVSKGSMSENAEMANPNGNGA